jgi:hypothetical protein
MSGALLVILVISCEALVIFGDFWYIIGDCSVISDELVVIFCDVG